MTTAANQQLAAELIHLLPSYLRSMLKRESNALSQGKISYPQFLALEHLWRHPNSRLKTLAQSLSIAEASACGLIDRMADAGFVLREADPDDRRAVNLSLSDKGSAVIREILKQREEIMSAVFEELGEAKTKVFVQTFADMLEVLQREKNNDS